MTGSIKFLPSGRTLWVTGRGNLLKSQGVNIDFSFFLLDITDQSLWRRVKKKKISEDTSRVYPPSHLSLIRLEQQRQRYSWQDTVTFLHSTNSASFTKTRSKEWKVRCDDTPMTTCFLHSPLCSGCFILPSIHLLSSPVLSSGSQGCWSLAQLS